MLDSIKILKQQNKKNENNNNEKNNNNNNNNNKKNNKKYKKNENKVEKIPNIFNEKNINNVEINNLNSDYKNGIFVFEKKNIDKQLLKLPINMIIVFKKMLKNQTAYINENINNFIIYSLNQINRSAF